MTSSNEQILEYAAIVMVASIAYINYGFFGLFCVQLCQRRKTRLMRTIQRSSRTDTLDSDAVRGWPWAVVKWYDRL